jgi:integrase
MWWPNLWLLTKHRNRGAASGTLANYGTVLARFYSWAECRGISPDQRLLQREWFVEWELDSLVDDLSIQIRGVKPANSAPKRPGNIEQFLAPKVSKVPLVRVETIATRLNIVANYMRWLGTEGVNRAPFAAKKIHESDRDEMIQKLVDKIPQDLDNKKSSCRPYNREGVLRLLEVTLPGHPDNPWRSAETQLRNHLIISMLFTFGLRIGELAALKSRDSDERAKVLAVARRPDDPDETRGRYAPHQKTRARVMTNELSDLIKTYKNKVRNRHDLALTHPYLLVSEQDGEKISMSALQKIFRVLRNNVSGLPQKLTAHYLRHAWNYEFSKVCKAKGIPDDEAEQLRKYLQGWSGSSEMPNLYNQPYIQERANECSLETQRSLFALSKESQAAFERMESLASEAKSKTHGATHV